MNYDLKLLRALHERWGNLPPLDRCQIGCIYLRNRLAVPHPVAFAYKTALLAFILLIALPPQPSTIFLAFGGALSINLLFHI